MDNNFEPIPDRGGIQPAEPVRIKQLPLIAAGTLAAVACAVRIIISVIFQNMETGAFTGPKALAYVSGALFAAALAALAIYAAKTYKGKLSRAASLSRLTSTFVLSVAGFFILFSSAFIVYSIFAGVEFHKGATVISEIILFVFSVGTAVFCFLEASSKSDKLYEKPAYPLMCLLPVGWAATRLFVMFTTFTARATYITEKLQILSVTALCIYFLYEARMMRAAKPADVKGYAVVTSLTLAIVPLSALPTLIFSLLYKTDARIGEPLFCLCELALCAAAAVRASDILSRAADKGSADERD